MMRLRRASVIAALPIYLRRDDPRLGCTAWEPTPWRAVQRAAWETLHRAR